MNKKISYSRIIIYSLLGFIVGYFVSTGLFWLGSQDIIFNPIISYVLGYLIILMPFILAIIGGFIGFTIKV